VTPGVFEPDGSWLLDTNHSGTRDSGDTVVHFPDFGQPGDIPVLGGWDPPGGSHPCNAEVSKLGVYRPSNHHFYLDVNNDRKWDNGDRDVFGFPGESFEVFHPFAWRIQVGSNCRTIPGVMRDTPFANGQNNWFVNLNDDDAIVTPSEGIGTFGMPGDIAAPIRKPSGVGSIIAVFRPSEDKWFIDLNGSGGWEGPPADVVAVFGISSSQIVVNPAQPFIGTHDGAEFLIDFNANFAWNGTGTGNDLLYSFPVSSGEIPVVGSF
jgi:hypothetical protein